MDFVSTGHLPSPAEAQALVTEAHERYRADDGGRNSQVYPALAAAPSDTFGICVVGTNGNVYVAGDAETEFTIMSVSKPFVFALVCEALGPEEARERLGVNSTGLPFNSLEAVERSGDGRTNPMVNSGAIATTSLLPGWDGHPRRAVPLRGPRALAERGGLPVGIGDERAQPTRSPRCSRASTGSTVIPPRRSISTRASALSTVTAKDLAVMGATLADGGVNPLTQERVIDARRAVTRLP